jgi:translocation and assembly module TamB
VELRGDVSGDANVQLKDLNFLRDFIPGLRRLEGDMRGDLHVSGPINDPAVTGSFSLKDGEVSHSFNFPMLSALNLQGDFDEHSVSISDMRAEVGGSPVNLIGSIRREKEIAEVSLQITGQNVLLFRNNDMRIRGDVELEVSGPLESLSVKGTTGLTGGYYTRNIDFLGMIGSSAAPVSVGGGFLFSFQDPPLNKAVFDIMITTIEPFRIRNNLIRGVLRPELSLKGTGELPFLVGVVYIDPTRVLLPSGRLRIQSGLLRFLAANPDRPELDLIAQSKLLGYDINLITRGPLDDLVITLSSSPPLPNEDLMLLLLTGQPPRDDVTAGVQSTASTNVMLYLGRDFLNRWLDDESGAADETIFDRFDLDFGRDVTKSGDQTVETSFRLSEEITGQGRMYYLTGEKDRYDAYNYGLRLVFRFE